MQAASLSSDRISCFRWLWPERPIDSSESIIDVPSSSLEVVVGASMKFGIIVEEPQLYGVRPGESI